MKTACRAALTEIGAVTEAMDERAFEAAAAAIAAAGRIMVYGCGREGLMMRGLAMRLYHLGLDAHVQGEMSAPPLGQSDLFIASAGPGQLSTVSALCATARAAGAKILFLTAVPDASEARRADHLLVIPAQTMANDRGPSAGTLPMGSVYEGALFIVFEALILALRDRLQSDPEAMRGRHTNME